MKKILSVLLLMAAFLCVSTEASAKDEVVAYEIEGAGVGQQGTYLVEVSVMQSGKKPDVEELKRKAVHGVLFRGFSSKDKRVRQKPLAGSAMAESKHQDYFDLFFKVGGPYQNYANAMTESIQVVKIAKKYRVSMIVTVAKDQLQKDLEAAGVLQGLNSLF